MRSWQSPVAIFCLNDRFGTFGTMAWAVGQLYVARYFPAEAKSQIEELVANLKAAYRVRIERLDWMGPPDQGRGAEEAGHVHHQGRLP